MKKYFTKNNTIILLSIALVAIIIFNLYLFYTPKKSIVGTYGVGNNVQDEFITIGYKMQYHRYKDGTLLESGEVKASNDNIYYISPKSGESYTQFLIVDEKIYKNTSDGFLIYFKKEKTPIYINYSPLK